MSITNYRRAGIYRRNTKGHWENFCDLHFTYESFDRGPFWFGANKLSINQIQKNLTEKAEIEADLEIDYNRDIPKGGDGWFERIQHPEGTAFRCLFFGMIEYEGAPYNHLELILFGDFRGAKSRKRAAKLSGVNYGQVPVPILRGEKNIYWIVDERRRHSLEKARTRRSRR